MEVKWHQSTLPVWSHLLLRSLNLQLYEQDNLIPLEFVCVPCSSWPHYTWKFSFLPECSFLFLFCTLKICIHLLNYWNIVDLKCSIHFCCIAKLINYTYIFFFIFIYNYGLSQDIEYSSLCCTLGSCSLTTSIYLSINACANPWIPIHLSSANNNNTN